MTAPSTAEFDACGPLPAAGVTVLEASAGTGKTFTIAALVARYVAEGVPLSEILAVTFTRMATGELRDRVRERLVTAHAAIGRLLDNGTPPPADDLVAAAIAEGTLNEVAERRGRLTEALASFDEATITTTHGFCHLVLSSMGVAGASAAGDTLIEDTSDLLEEVVDDVYLRRSLGYGPPEFTRSQALNVARATIRNSDTVLEPPADDSTAGRLRRFAERVRSEFGSRLRTGNLLTYDDLLIRLRDALVDPARGQRACFRLADRYRVVLVDEFQDTDPVQWEVVSNAFGSGETVLVLIGDPKQAIYAFRGADVYAYLAASASAGRHFTLGDNYRSDLGLLRALDALMDPLLLGHSEIPYRVVRAIPRHERPGLQGAPSSAALRARVLHSNEHNVTLTASRGLVQKQTAIEWVAEDLASDVVELLSSGAHLVHWDDASEEEGHEPITPADIAVLVRTNHQAAVVHEALRSVGVPAVVASSVSVLATPAAKAWLQLLEALEQPASRSRSASVAIGPFVGMSAEQLATATEADLEDLHFRLVGLGQILRQRGVGALFRTACIEGDAPARLLSHRDGEREMTDLTHVAELLVAEASFSQLGLPRLRAWLAHRICELRDEDEAEERTRRLDSDHEAVQVLTVHRAKGLEFPVVYCPYVWDVGGQREEQPVIFHDAADGNRRKLDVGPDGPAYRTHSRASHEEERGEQLRHLYVSLTRAKHQVVMWWARTDKCQHSPLGRLLFSRDLDGTVTPDGGSRVPSDAQVSERLAAVAASAPGDFAVERASGPSGRRWSSAVTELGSLEVAAFHRTLDRSWRRTSYSAITANAHEDTIGSEPEAPGKMDEPAAGTSTPQAHFGLPAPSAPSGNADDALQVACPLGEMPTGAEVGTVVHRILELVDFAGYDLEQELSVALGAATARHSVSLGPAESVAAGLHSAICTPLGPLVDDIRLRDIPRTDRLDELGFELPVAGGDAPHGSAITVGALAEVLSRHERRGDPLAGYASRLADPMLAREFRGYLAGAIDLVFRLGTGDEARYFVVDYKSNRLAPSEEELRAWHYRPEALDAEMRRHHYPLQGLFYFVALHRYLRWRMARYDPSRNLGGVLYLFVRGTLGPETPKVDSHPCGVFAWRPAPDLVCDLSDLLDSGVGKVTAAAS